MRRHLVMARVAVACVAAAMVVLTPIAAAQPPPMGGGYAKVIRIPVDDPQVKAISGALFEPEGAGPFPTVIYLPGCDGAGSPQAMKLQKVFIENEVADGQAVLILDSFTARGFDNGVCDKTDMAFILHRAEDAYAAQRALAQRAEIDAKRIYLQGYGQGATTALLAVRSNFAVRYGGPVFAGVVVSWP